MSRVRKGAKRRTNAALDRVQGAAAPGQIPPYARRNAHFPQRRKFAHAPILAALISKVERYPQSQIPFFQPSVSEWFLA